MKGDGCNPLSPEPTPVPGLCGKARPCLMEGRVLCGHWLKMLWRDVQWVVPRCFQYGEAELKLASKRLPSSRWTVAAVLVARSKPGTLSPV